VTTQPDAFWRLEVHSALPSTADLLLARAEAGEAEGLAILALQQTAGRGRAGRVWASPPGNLYLSVLLRPAGPAREAPQWSLLAGVALAEAAALHAPGPFQLKWPNDLLRGEAKCAGILAETVLAPQGGLLGSPFGGIAFVSLGIGVNLAHAPALAERPTATLGAATTPEAFAQSLLARLAAWRQVQAEAGFAPVRQAWARLGPPLGAPLTLRDGPEAARFAGLTEEGALLIDVHGTHRAIRAGEVLAKGET
jgi:BirA family biotin operon repressor/biotin-[acetyl-CoA-carboxylase] ligase